MADETTLKDGAGKKEWTPDSPVTMTSAALKARLDRARRIAREEAQAAERAAVQAELDSLRAHAQEAERRGQEAGLKYQSDLDRAFAERDRFATKAELTRALMAGGCLKESLSDALALITLEHKALVREGVVVLTSADGQELTPEAAAESFLKERLNFVRANQRQGSGVWGTLILPSEDMGWANRPSQDEMSTPEGRIRAVRRYGPRK